MTFLSTRLSSTARTWTCSDSELVVAAEAVAEVEEEEEEEVNSSAPSIFSGLQTIERTSFLAITHYKRRKKENPKKSNFQSISKIQEKEKEKEKFESLFFFTWFSVSRTLILIMGGEENWGKLEGYGELLCKKERKKKKKGG